jgi:hypothetical protein
VPSKKQSRPLNNADILAKARATRRTFYSQIFEVVKDYPFSSPPVPHIQAPAPLARDRGPYADLGRRIRLDDHSPSGSWGD